METVFYTSFERAVMDLERAVCRDRSHVVLASSPGPGRTTLTRVLEERLAGTLQALELPVPTAAREEICARILHELGADRSTVEEDLLPGRLRDLAASGSALVLLIRDADAMPAETLSWLGRIAAESNKGLRLVLVVTTAGGSKGELIPGLIGALGVGAQKVVLEGLGERVAESRLPVGAASRWANPLRSRLETIRAVTVRPQSRRGTRWQIHVAVAAATVVLGLELHRSMERPGVAAPATAQTLGVEAPVVATQPRRGPQPPRAEPALQLTGLAVEARLSEAREVPRAKELSLREENGRREAPERRREETEAGGERVDAATVAGGRLPETSDVAALALPRAGEPASAEPVAAKRAPDPRAARATDRTRPGVALEEEKTLSVLPHVATLPAEVPSTHASKPGLEVTAPPASPVAALGSRATDDFLRSPDSPPEVRLESNPASEAAAAPPVEPEHPEVRSGAAVGAPLVSVSVNARPWARIQVDGRDVGVTPLSGLEMSPGRHLFRARLPDGRELEQTVHVDQYRDRISFP